MDARQPGALAASPLEALTTFTRSQGLPQDGHELATPPDGLVLADRSGSVPSVPTTTSTAAGLGGTDPFAVTTVHWYLHRTNGHVDLAVRVNQTSGEWKQGAHEPGGWYADFASGCAS